MDACPNSNQTMLILEELPVRKAHLKAVRDARILVESAGESKRDAETQQGKVTKFLAACTRLRAFAFLSIFSAP
jgi:hypothetical protein